MIKIRAHFFLINLVSNIRHILTMHISEIYRWWTGLTRPQTGGNSEPFFDPASSPSAAAAAVAASPTSQVDARGVVLRRGKCLPSMRLEIKPQKGRNVSVRRGGGGGRELGHAGLRNQAISGLTHIRGAPGGKECSTQT
jgi:hypothetical protein